MNNSEVHQINIPLRSGLAGTAGLLISLSILASLYFINLGKDYFHFAPLLKNMLVYSGLWFPLIYILTNHKLNRSHKVNAIKLPKLLWSLFLLNAISFITAAFIYVQFFQEPLMFKVSLVFLSTATTILQIVLIWLNLEISFFISKNTIRSKQHLVPIKHSKFVVAALTALFFVTLYSHLIDYSGLTFPGSVDGKLFPENVKDAMRSDATVKTRELIWLSCVFLISVAATRLGINHVPHNNLLRIISTAALALVAHLVLFLLVIICWLIIPDGIVRTQLIGNPILLYILFSITQVLSIFFSMWLLSHLLLNAKPKQ